MQNSATATEVELRKLDVIYRNIKFLNRSLFLCTLPNGLTYDLLVCNDGSVKLWRFVGTTSPLKAGMRIECRRAEHPYAVVGFEITDEGDICLYAEQQIDFDNLHSARSIRKLIEGYSGIITNYAIENVSM